MNELRDPEVKLSGSDTGTCWLAVPSEAPQHFHTDSHQHIEPVILLINRLAR